MNQQRQSCSFYPTCGEIMVQQLGCGHSSLAVLGWPVYLQRASVVRWGQCYKHTAQTVCGLLLLVHQPAMEESKVITYKALKWNWGKNNENVRCSSCLWLSCIFFDLWCFFHPFCFIHIMHCAVGILENCTGEHLQSLKTLLCWLFDTYLPSWTQTC